MGEKFFSKAIATLFFLFLVASQSFSQEKVYEVLYINSYHNGYFWSDGVTEGIKKTISKHSEIVLNIEYLDSKRDPSYYNDPLCLKLFEKKYANRNIDIIITSDNDALDFVLLNNNHPIFENKIHIACGISNINDYKNRPNLHLVKEITTFEESIVIMESFFPEMKELVFLTDTLTSGQIYINQVNNILNKNYPNIKLKVYNCIDLNTLADSIKLIPPSSCIFCSAVNSDCSQNAINDYDVAEIVAENAKAPLFSGYYSSIMDGFIGGCMTTGEQSGTIAAQLTINTLTKQLPLKKITIPDVISIFDHKQLRKYKINKNKIPEGSIILRSPESFWTKNKKVIIISGLIIIQLLLVIGLQYRAVKRQKVYEKKLIIAMEKAKESDRLKSIFLRNVSHEMRTPLNSIVGFSDVLNDMIEEKPQKSYLKMIAENAHSLTSLINHVFDFSLLKSHKYELDISTFKISSLIEKLIEDKDLNKLYQNKPLKLTKDFDTKHLDKTITTDKEKLYLVIRHILQNALKYTEKGEVALRYRFSKNEFEFHSQDNEPDDFKYIVFHIQDTGKGISNEDLEYIFDPFRQVEERNIDANRGIGLGLSISKSIIKILKGDIRVASTPNEGSTFFFSIPINIEA